jgi:hypothetical protein
VLLGERQRPELIPLARGSSLLGRMGVPYIYPAVSGMTIRAEKLVLDADR